MEATSNAAAAGTSATAPGGHDPAALRGVREMLDRGDMARILEALDLAALDSPEAGHALEHALEDECQRADVAGAETAMFAIPVLVDPGATARLDARAVLEILERLAARGERIALADGWVRPSDIEALDCVTARVLARTLGMAAWAGTRLVAELPDGALSAFPLDHSDRAGGVACWRRGEAARAVVPRMILGAVARRARTVPGKPGAFGLLVDGELGAEGLASLGAMIEAACGGRATAMLPGQPVWVAHGVAGVIETFALEETLRSILDRTGRKPVTHFHIDHSAGRVDLVMTSDGVEVMDTATVRFAAMDTDRVLDLVANGSAGLLREDSAAMLPQAGTRTMH